MALAMIHSMLQVKHQRMLFLLALAAGPLACWLLVSGALPQLGFVGGWLLFTVFVMSFVIAGLLFWNGRLVSSKTHTLLVQLIFAVYFAFFFFVSLPVLVPRAFSFDLLSIILIAFNFYLFLLLVASIRSDLRSRVR